MRHTNILLLAAWGGGALFSPEHRGALDGADLADSLVWSAHKMLGVALQCAIFLSHHPGALKACNATDAAYLYQPDKLHASLDLGDRTVQCGRKADMLKLWLLFKSLGDSGCASRIEHCYAMAAHLSKRITESEGAFRLAYPTSCTNVCFWYIPRSLRPLLATPRNSQRGSERGSPIRGSTMRTMPGTPPGTPPGAGSRWPPPPNSARHAALHGVAPKIKAALQRAGEAMIGNLPPAPHPPPVSPLLSLLIPSSSPPHPLLIPY